MKPLTTTQALQTNTASLRKILLTAGAELWAAQQVEQHKQQELASCKPPNIWWKLDNVLGGYTPSLALLLIICGGISSKLNVPALPLVLAGAGMYIMLFAHARGPASWNSYPLCSDNSYWSAERRELVMPPYFVRQLMNTITSLSPEVRFRVLSLEQKHYVLDPFLYAELNGEEIACAAWDADDKPISPH